MIFCFHRHRSLLLDTDIVLLQRSLQDAYNQYKGGLVDKTDYQRATISLNNALAPRKQLRRNTEKQDRNIKIIDELPGGFQPSGNLRQRQH